MENVVKESVIRFVEERMSSPYSSDNGVVMALAKTIKSEDSRNALAKIMTTRSVTIHDIWETREERQKFWEDYLSEVAELGVDYELKLKSLRD